MAPPPVAHPKVKHGAVEVVAKTIAVVDTEAGRKAHTENGEGSTQFLKIKILTKHLKLIDFSCQDIFLKINKLFMQRKSFQVD